MSSSLSFSFRRWMMEYTLFHRYTRKGWVLVCHPPNYFNVAFPDLSARYWIAFFSPNDRVVVEGGVPLDCDYFSVHCYNSYGEWIGGLHDQDERLQHLPAFCLSFGEEDGSSSPPQEPSNHSTAPIRIGSNISSPFCLIVRWYRSSSLGNADTEEWILPSLKVQGEVLRSSEWRDRYQTSRQWTTLVQRFLMLRPRTPPERYQREDDMVSPSFSDTRLLFPNPDAQYWILVPKTPVVQIHVQLVSPWTCRYAAFMVGNIRTTETIHGWKCDLSSGEKQTVYISPSMEMARQYGWSDPIPLLLYSTTIKETLILFRQINRLRFKPFFQILCHRSPPSVLRVQGG